MAALTEQDVAQKTLAISGTGTDVYRPVYGHHPYDKTPSMVYFYYLAWKANSLPDIRHYHFERETPIQPGDLPGIARTLGRTARGPAVPDATNFEKIEWKRKSYLIFLMDSKVWSLLKRRDGGTALWFDPEDGKKQENHAFFDAMDFDVDLSFHNDGTDMVSAVACINHMKRSQQGDDLGVAPDGSTYTESQYFKFSVAYRALGTNFTTTYDPDGTNTGPPAPPPALSLTVPPAPPVPGVSEG